MDEEIQQLKQQVNDVRRQFGEGSREYSTAVASLNRALRKQISSITQYTNVVTGLAGSLARGNTSMTQLNGMVNSVTNAMSAMAIAYPPLAVGIKLFGEGLEVAIQQFDNALGVFYNLGQVGALGAEGIDSLRKQFIRAGVPMEVYQQMLLKNTEALAGFYGSANEGAEQFSGIIGALKASGLDMDLRALGMNSSEVSDTLANYANIQRRIGGEAVRNQGLLTKGTVEYGKQLDMLAKITGKSREQQQNLLDQSLSEARFRAVRAKMERDGAGAQGKQLDQFMLLVSNISPTLGQAIRDVSSGFISTQAAQQGFLTTGGQLPGIIEGLKNGQLDYASAIGLVQNATKSQLPMMESLALGVGDSTGAFVPFAESMDLTTYALGDLEKALVKTKTQQDIQAKAVGLTGPTQALIEINKNLEFAASKFQGLAISFDSIASVSGEITNGIKKFSDVVYNAVGTVGDQDVTERIRNIDAKIVNIKGAMLNLSDVGVDPLAVGSSEQLANLQTQLDVAIKQKEYYKNLSTLDVAKPVTFKSAVMSTNQDTRDKTWMPDWLSPTTQGEYSIDSELQKRGINLSAPMTKESQVDYNKLVEQFEGDTTSKYFLDELKKIYERQVGSGNSSEQSSLNTDAIVNAIKHGNENTNKKLDTIISQNYDGNSTANKQLVAVRNQ